METKESQCDLTVLDTAKFKLSGVFPHGNSVGTRASVWIKCKFKLTSFYCRRRGSTNFALASPHHDGINKQPLFSNRLPILAMACESQWEQALWKMASRVNLKIWPRLALSTLWRARQPDRKVQGTCGNATPAAIKTVNVGSQVLHFLLLGFLPAFFNKPVDISRNC